MPWTTIWQNPDASTSEAIKKQPQQNITRFEAQKADKQVQDADLMTMLAKHKKGL